MRCHSGVTGLPLDHAATGHLTAPDGRRIVAMCEEHAAEVVEEYRAKLGESWSFVPELRRVREPNVHNLHTSDGEAVNRSVFCRCQRADRATVHFRADRSPIAGRACRFCRCVVRAEEVAS